MAIKRRNIKKVVIISFLLIGGLIVGVLGANHQIPNALGSGEMPKTSSEKILVDKIFMFEAPNDTKRFDNQFLEAHYNYRVLMEIVTPHECIMNVTIIDPDLDVYQVYRLVENISQDDGWLDFPFGTVMSGNYTFVFSVVAEFRLNVYIKISYDPEFDKCLYNILPPWEIEKLELYRLSKFYNQTVIEHHVELKSDYYYKFYIGRLSPIGGESPVENEVTADYDLDNPDGKPYLIYRNEMLADIGYIRLFNFATAVAGTYTIRIQIYCKVDVVNIGLAVVEDYKKSTENDGNSTTPDPEDPVDPTNVTKPLNYYYVPIEWTLAFGLSAGGLLAILVVFGAVRRKKDSVSLRTN